MILGYPAPLARVMKMIVYIIEMYPQAHPWALLHSHRVVELQRMKLISDASCFLNVAIDRSNSVSDTRNDCKTEPYS